MFHNCRFRRNLVIKHGATYTKTTRGFDWGAEVEAVQTDASSGYHWCHTGEKKACVSPVSTHSLLAFTLEKNVKDRPRKTRKLIFTPYSERFFSRPQHLSPGSWRLKLDHGYKAIFKMKKYVGLYTTIEEFWMANIWTVQRDLLLTCAFSSMKNYEKNMVLKLAILTIIFKQHNV